jgi:hypothetical protein
MPPRTTMVGKGKKQVGSRKYREVKRMKARMRKKKVARKQMRVWKRMRRVRRVQKSNPQKKGGRERKQPIDRKNGGKEKKKVGKAEKEKKRINRDPENKEKEKKKKRKKESEQDKKKAQNNSNKDEGLCVGCKQPPNTTNRCASKGCTNFVHEFCGYETKSKKTCPDCRYIPLFSHLILPEELGSLQIKNLQPRSPRKRTSLLLFLLLCP